MDHFVEQLSARFDATASDLKTSLHEHVDSTVDSSLDTFKRELSSIIRSGVVECIRAQGRNQHWRVETTYIPVSANSQHLSGEVPLMANHTTSFLQGIPLPLLPEENAAPGMSTIDQCIVDVTFPSGPSMSIPLNDTPVSNNQYFAEYISEQTIHGQLIPSRVSTRGAHSSPFSNVHLNITQQNTSFQSAQTTHNGQQIKQEPLDYSLVIPMDQFSPNDYPLPSPSHQCIKSEDEDSDFCPCHDCLNGTLITKQTEGGDQLKFSLNSTDTSNESNNQSQVARINLKHSLNGNIPSADVKDDGQGAIDEASAEAPLVNVNQLMMTASSSGRINTGAQSSIIQIPSISSAFRTVQPTSVNDDDNESCTDTLSNQNRESPTMQSKRKLVASNDQSITAKKVKHDGQNNIDDHDNGQKIKTIYFNCTELDCDDHLKSVDNLRQHLTTKHGLLPYQCYARECNVRCESGQGLQCHLRDHHTDSSEFVCPICDIQLASQKAVNKHLYRMHYTGKFQCNIVGECKQIGDTFKEIDLHLQRCNYHTRLQCDQCSFKFVNQTKLDAHYIRHTRFNPFRCTWPQCHFQTNEHTSVITHIRMKHFGLPMSVKRQIEKNIVDDRDPADFVAEVTEQAN